MAIRFLPLFLLLVSTSIRAADLEIVAPQVALTDVAATVVVQGASPGEQLQLHAGSGRYSAAADADGRAVFDAVILQQSGRFDVRVAGSGDRSAYSSMRVIPGWVSIFPPLVAIFVALSLRNVIPALLLGIWFGATALRSFTPSGIFGGLLDSFQIFVARALADFDHASVILFSMMIGGMVGIITRNGGVVSIVHGLVSRAKTAVVGQVSVWLMGLVIFFDDYSNTLIVGNTARPLTDHLKISREKLAYIVDSTAAPVASLALVTTWIGYEVGLIDEALKGLTGLDEQAYTVFLRSIPFSFYAIFAVIFVLIVASSGRDMGPMYQAELRARRGESPSGNTGQRTAIQGEELEPKPGIPLRAFNAFVPLLVLVIALPAGLFITGEGDTLTEIVGSADAYKAMMWASFLGVIAAAVLSVGQGILTPQETVDAWYGGVKTMLFTMIVLVLAWALSGVSEALHTADYLITVLADSLPVALVPAVVFLLSAFTAFTTGTSWGTMGILMPLVVPLAWAVLQSQGMADPEHYHILYSAVACNLAGAVWGDHCSPISDTTVLSSVASGCDHIEHVRTQLPYAFLVGSVAILVGTIPAGYGFPWWLSIVIGVAILFCILRFFGRRPEDALESGSDQKSP